MVVTVTIIDPPGVPDLASVKHFVRERRLLGEWEALTLWQTGLCFTPHVPRIHFYCSCKCFLISTVYFKMKDQPVSNIVLTCHIINLASVFYLIIIEKRRIKGCLPARAHSVQPNARSICGECLTWTLTFLKLSCHTEFKTDVFFIGSTSMNRLLPVLLRQTSMHY